MAEDGIVAGKSSGANAVSSKPAGVNAVSGKAADSKVTGADSASPQSVRQLAEHQEVNQPIPLEANEFEQPLKEYGEVRDIDTSSRVFDTKNIISSARQLQIVAVTMHAPTDTLLNPRRRRKRPNEFKSMMRRLRTIRQEEPSSPRSQQ